MKILIVEDDVDSGEALMQLLDDLGHEVRLVHCPTLAVAAVAAFVPEVAILDIGLPRISGYELLDRLRRIPALDSCRYFAVTAYAGTDLAQRSAEAGFEYHLTKPLRVGRLLECLGSRSAVSRSAVMAAAG